VIRLRLLTVLKKNEVGQIPVILGNGIEEVRILTYLAPKFDGTRCALVDTHAPLPGLGVVKGPSALRNLAWLLVYGYRVEKALFLIDKEHVQDFENIAETLSEYGFIVEKTMKLGRGFGSSI